MLIKLILLLIGFLFWQGCVEFCIGSQFTSGLFITQAMYSRWRYFNNDYIRGQLTEIQAEVIYV